MTLGVHLTDGLPRITPGRRRTACRPSTADHTQAEIFAVILTQGPLSRTQVAQVTGLSPATVTKSVNPLVATGYLVEDGAAGSGVGRPQRLLRVKRDRHAVLGIKLAPAVVTGVRTDMEAHVEARVARPIADSAPDTVLAAVTDIAAELLGAEPDVRERALAIGVGVSGHVDTAAGVCLKSGLLGWEDVDISGPLGAVTGLPVVVNNDVNTLVIAEKWFGHGRGVSSFAVVTVGAGVGCGLVIGGELYAGSTGLAGELGHVALDADGPECTCGNRGCLEAIASDRGILLGIATRGGPVMSSLDEAVMAARDDAGTTGSAAREAFQAAGSAVGQGISILLNLLNLEMVVLSGEGVVASDLFGEALRSGLAAHAFSTSARDCELVIRPVEDESWARGAACLVIREAVGASPSNQLLELTR